MLKRLEECISGKYENRIAPFLWLHGEDDNLILEELDKIYESGIRGVCLESRTHEDFCREGWWEDVKLILKRCSELDMKVWILDDKHFPSGYGNGIFEEKYKHLRKYDITERHTDFKGPVEDGCLLAGTIQEDEELLACILCRRNPDEEHFTLEDAVDVTSNIKDDLLFLNVGEGDWRVIFLLKRPTPGNFAVFSDKLSGAATDAIIEEIYEAHYREIGEYFGNTFAGFFSDEPGFHNNQDAQFITPIGKDRAKYPWHENIRAFMYEKYGEHMWEKLANLFCIIKGESQEARETYLDGISKLYNENYSGRLAKWCHEHGVMYIGHIIEDNNAASQTGATVPHYFRAIEGQDMSGIDVVLSQIIPGVTMDHSHYTVFSYGSQDFYQYTLAKLASSMAHTNELMNGRAMCEVFGAYGWAEGSKIMKWLTDFMLVRGINYFVPHAFSPKENDLDCPPNFYARGENPQYKYFKYIMYNMNRGAHLLTEGKPCVSCGMLYDTEVRWNGGKFLACDDVAKELCSNQIDFDYICCDYLLSSSVKDGQLKVGQSTYKVLLVPYAEYMPYAVLKKLEEIKAQGAKVVWIDNTADFATGGVLGDLTKNATIIPLNGLLDYIYKEDFYDIRLSDRNSEIKVCKRQKGDECIYMFFNEGVHNTFRGKIELKGFEGGEYLVYDAMSNEVFKKSSVGSFIELTISPYQSLFVFTGVCCDNYADEDTSDKVLESEFFDYEVSLARIKEDYKPYKHLTEPENITGSRGITDFSGCVKYEGSFFAENDGAYELDLGKVGEIAEVYINGAFVGEKLIPPYRFDITKAVHKGRNDIKIEVSNTAVFKNRDAFSAYLMIEPTGLISKTRLYRKEK